MMTLYHGSNVRIQEIDLAECHPYKDFGQEFKFMTEGIAADLIQLLMDRQGYSLPQAVETVYGSQTYAALLRPASGLYAQSSGYVYSILETEILTGKLG